MWTSHCSTDVLPHFLQQCTDIPWEHNPNLVLPPSNCVHQVSLSMTRVVTDMVYVSNDCTHLQGGAICQHTYNIFWSNWIITICFLSIALFSEFLKSFINPHWVTVNYVLEQQNKVLLLYFNTLISRGWEDRGGDIRLDNESHMLLRCICTLRRTSFALETNVTKTNIYFRGCTVSTMKGVNGEGK